MARRYQLNLPQLLRQEERMRAGHQANMQSVHSQKVTLVRNRKYSCPFCQHVGSLSTWGFLQGHTYTSPSGCSGGDYWTPNDTDVCHLICPACIKQVYIYNYTEKESLLYLIGSIGVEKKEIFAMIYNKHGDDVKQVHPEESQQSLL